MAKPTVLNVKDVVPFSPKGAEGKYASRLLIDAEGVGSRSMVLNHFTLAAGQKTYYGSHPAPFDEIYYILQGTGLLTLSEEGKPRVYSVEAGSVAFIAATVHHQIENTGTEDLEMLTMMPFQPEPGVNTLYDERKRQWGTSFKLKEERAEESSVARKG